MRDVARSYSERAWWAMRTIVALGSMLGLAACGTTRGAYVLLGPSFPPLPAGFDVEVLATGVPDRPYVRVSRLDVHLEKTSFVEPGFDEALPVLKEQARLSGAHAIFEVEERRSSLLETRIYHVTATGIRYGPAGP